MSNIEEFVLYYFVSLFMCFLFARSLDKGDDNKAYIIAMGLIPIFNMGLAIFSCFCLIFKILMKYANKK